jgi:hypothetical protein
MSRQMKPYIKKDFEDDSFIRSRLKHSLRAGGSTIPFGEIASITLY